MPGSHGRLHVLLASCKGIGIHLFLDLLEENDWN